MELLNEVQQLGAHTGSHKRAAVFASRFCQPGVLAIEAPSKYPIITRLFGSTGSVHGIRSKFGPNHAINDQRKTGFNGFGTGEWWLLQIESARPGGEARHESTRQEIVRSLLKMLAEGHGELPPLRIDEGKKTYLPAKDSAALAAKAFELLGIDSITFISCQSYGNSLPQPRQATYVPVNCAAGESLWPGRLVIGKLKFL